MLKGLSKTFFGPWFSFLPSPHREIPHLGPKKGPNSLSERDILTDLSGVEFKDILARKMKVHEEETIPFQEAKMASNFKILHLEPDFRSQERRFTPHKNPYPKGAVFTEILPHQELSDTPPMEPLIEVEKLDSAGRFSLEIFMKLGATELEKSHFSPRELKKSFRRLAKIYHPDHTSTGGTEDFQQLKMAFDTLKKGVA